MRLATLMLLTLLSSFPALAQSPDTGLESELSAIHDKWFKAFDSGDGATMDQLEVEKLVLIMPNGYVWNKTKPRAGEQQKSHSPTQYSLSSAEVRRFGDTAILTGIVSSKSAEENTQDATTVVFLHSSGKWKIASAQWTPIEGKK
jgi:ketosteroid isomerase-like protein